MSVGRYSIAGLKVEMDVIYDVLAERSRKYRYDFDGEPDVRISAPARGLAFLKEEHPGLSDPMLEYMFTGNLFYNHLLRFGGFMLHSSCVGYGEKAYLFSADSGTGKSSHTGLWLKYIDGVTLINDDKPAVRLQGDTFYAMGTPWSGKFDKSADISAPIGGLAMLYRGERGRIRPALPAESVMFLLRQTTFPARRENTDRLADLLDKFLRTVPLYRFECDISEQSVAVSFEAMTGEKYVKRDIPCGNQKTTI